MERLELKTNAGSRVAIGLILLLFLLPVVILGKTTGLVIAIAVVAGFIALCVAMGKRRLVLDERGISAKGMSNVCRLEWDEIDHYTFWSMDPQAAYAGAGGQGAIAVLVVIAIIAIARRVSKRKNEHRRFAQGQLMLVGKDGRKLPVDVRYKNVGPALDRIFAELHPRLRARNQIESFGPLQLTQAEVRHVKKGTLGLADIEKIGAGAARITVKKRGKRLAWVNIPMKKVTNVMLFLEIAAEHGLVVNANAEVFVPPTVLDKLRAAASRQAAMPQARVVSR